MAAEAYVRARIDTATKAIAEDNLRKIGLTPSVVIRQLMRHIAAAGTVPFDLRIPNATTVAAIEELETGGGTRHPSVKSLMADLDADD